MIFVGENLQAKGSQKLFGQVWGNSGKNPLHPQKFACSCTYDLVRWSLFRDGGRAPVPPAGGANKKESPKS